MIDIMKIRMLVKDGKLEVYISKGKIYMRDTENGETIWIGNVESEE